MIPKLQLSDGEISFYRQLGFLTIPGLLSDSCAGGLREEVADIMNAIGGVAGNKLRQTTEYLENSALDRFVNDANLRDLAAQLLGGPCSVYMPFTAVKGSGGGQFHFHQDNQYTHFTDGMHGINLWFALSPMTPENGCLMVVPRSHLAGTLESDLSGDGDQHKRVKIEPTDFYPLRMRPGDCVAFSRLTVHGSGPNMTNDLRIAYAVQFNRDDAMYTDPQTKELKSLKEFPRYVNKPVKELTIPKGKTDGH